MFLDARGDEIKEGDRVFQSALDSSRGTQHGYTHGTVVGFGRTRVIVQFDGFGGDPARVGGELLVVTDPVDDRKLRSWDDVWAERGGR